MSASCAMMSPQVRRYGGGLKTSQNGIGKLATIEKYTTSRGEFYMVRYRQPNGKTTKKRGFETKRDAKNHAATVEVKKLAGEYVSPKLGKITVDELGPSWLQRQKGHMKPSGFRSYENAWKNHVKEKWGSTSIGKINRSDVQAWVSGLSQDKADETGKILKRGLSASTVITIFSVLARILDDAATDRLIVVNPARGVKLPRRVKGRNVYLTAGQLHHLADESGRYRGLVLLLGTVGLRWGEAAALRVADVDFLRRRILLHENAVQVAGKIIVGSLKTGNKRTVALPGFVADALAVSCEGKGRDDLIWPSATGGHLGPPSSVRSWLVGAVSRCQSADPTFPRVTAHALRHTAASLAVSSGANVKVVQRMIGHASAAMTLDVYADLFDDDLNAVADRLDAQYSGEITPDQRRSR